jgi:hypothetical protein
MPDGFFDGPMSGLPAGLPGIVLAMTICLSCVCW